MRLTLIVLVLLVTFLSIYCLDLNQYETSYRQKTKSEKFKQSAKNAYIRNLSNIKANLRHDFLKKGYRKCLSLNNKIKILECLELLKESTLRNFYVKKTNYQDKVDVDNFSNPDNNLDQFDSNDLVLDSYTPIERTRTLKTIVSYGPEYNNKGDYSSSNKDNYSPNNKYNENTLGNYNQEEYYPKRSRSRSKSRSRSRNRSRSRSRSRTRSRSRSRSRSVRRSRSLVRRRNRLRRLFCNDLDRRNDSICQTRRRRL